MKNIENAKKSIRYKIIIFLLICILIFILFYYYLYLKKYNTCIPASYLVHHMNYDRKKVCLLYSGEIRENYFNTLFTHKIMFQKVLDVDVFCVFTDIEKSMIKKDIVDLLEPKRIEWIDEKEDHQKNFMYGLYGKIHLCNKLKVEYEKENRFVYDICVRIRPDLYIKNYVPEVIINQIEEGVIYSPYHDDLDYVTNISFMGLTDQLWLSSSNTMNTICDLYLYLLDYDHSNCMTSEIILKMYIRDRNIRIHYFKNYYFIIERINNEKVSLFGLFYYFFKKDSSIKCYPLLWNYFYKTQSEVKMK